MHAPRASAVVLSYDGRDLLESFLPSVLAQDYGDFEVVVVDNGSTDGSVGMLRERWPEVRIVALPENVGVTAALNAMVRAGEGEYVALLNNDVELEPSWLRILVGVMDRRPELASSAGKLLQHRNRGRIDRVGDEVRWSSACFGRGSGDLDSGQFETGEEVFTVGGAAAVYRRSAFARVGPFDDDFFAYVEDVDWGFRARLAGYAAWYEPTAVGYHLGGGTLGGINPFSLYHLRRNQLWLVLKNYPAASLLRHGPSVLLFNLAGLGMAVRRRQVGLVLKAYRDALRGVRPALRKRRTIQRSRTVGSRELERFIERAGRPW
ncbi:glycosyltransferase family 2 protein [Patulibacter sp.]|uniref:glycosyltransferase family 2 protein n=1 Tax=Patulibacter sp. TaxID=1912859 RepID=UPI002720723C|nr:glycosyltransferase family 2 protein [Patulibacter sp.]MDO9408197.1 glycosyltransferase family 2 protein [Patulibacter sp.]